MITIVREATLAEMDDVYKLVHDAYVSVGYIKPTADGRLKHYTHCDGIPETHVLVCYEDGILVGTNSWTIDGPHGLHTDVDFKKETDEIRKEGRVLGDSWRICTAPTLVKTTNVVLTLIKRTIKDMISAGILTGLATLNKKHERAYQRLLNMSTIAYKDHAEGFMGIIPVLMRLDLDKDVPVRFLNG